ncbi:MAG: intersectin-EH binding protein Ibp1 [Mycolicibacterium cosmeticum]|nr:intersectin-EH binding protein Ibp1 [Mycolicibacterium cosmeticum]
MELPATVGFSLRALATAVGVMAAAAAFPVAAAAPPVHCPAGEAEDLFTGVCMPHIVPNSPQITFGSGPNPLPEVDGVPCTGQNSYECLGLAEEPPTPSPSPTSKVGR